MLRKASRAQPAVEQFKKRLGAGAKSEPKVVRLRISEMQRANRLRDRWQPYGLVHHRVLGIGQIRDVREDPNGGDGRCYGPRALATVDFPTHPGIERPITAFTPVLTFSQLVELTGLSAEEAAKLQADPALKPDVAVDASRKILQPYYLYDWIDRARPPENALPRGAAAHLISLETARALQERLVLLGLQDRSVAQRAEVDDRVVVFLRHGKITRRDSAGRVAATLAVLEEEHGIEALKQSARSVLLPTVDRFLDGLAHAEKAGHVEPLASQRAELRSLLAAASVDQIAGVSRWQRPRLVMLRAREVEASFDEARMLALSLKALLIRAVPLEVDTFEVAAARGVPKRPTSPITVPSAQTPARDLGTRSSAAVLRQLNRTSDLGWSDHAIARNCGVTVEFLDRVREEKAKFDRREALDFLRGLRLLRDAAAPLPVARFELEDILRLKRRLDSVRLGANERILPVLAEGLMNLLKAAHAAGVTIADLEAGTGFTRRTVVETFLPGRSSTQNTALVFLSALTVARERWKRTPGLSGLSQTSPVTANGRPTDWLPEDRRAVLQKRIGMAHYPEAALAARASVSARTVRLVADGNRTRLRVGAAIEKALRGMKKDGVPRTGFVDRRRRGELVRELDAAQAQEWSYRMIGSTIGADASLIQQVHKKGRGIGYDRFVALRRGLAKLRRAAAPLPTMGFNARSIEALKARLALLPSDPGPNLIPVLATALTELIREAEKRGALPPGGEYGYPELETDGIRPRLGRARTLLEGIEARMREPADPSPTPLEDRGGFAPRHAQRR